MAYPFDALIDLLKDVHTGGGGSGSLRTTAEIGDVQLDPTVLLGQTPTLVNINTTTANTEYSYTLPTNTKRFILKARGLSRVQVAYTPGDSATTYLTIPPGSVYEESGIYSGSTLYFQASKGTEIVEIVSWV